MFHKNTEVLAKKNKKTRAEKALEEIPNFSGKTAIVTGANSGLGLELTKQLASQGYHVIMACRNQQNAQQAREGILADDASIHTKLISVEVLDLSKFSSVEAFCANIKKHYKKISLLVNNAGVLGLPYQLTEDGYDTVFQTNYLCTVKLTMSLLPLLKNNEHARVVTVGSLAAHKGKIKLDSNGDIDFHRLQPNETNYKKSDAYATSKLAAVMFAVELSKRLQADDESKNRVESVLAHPGYAKTNILSKGDNSCITSCFFKTGNAVLAQSAEQGVIPVMHACVGDGVVSGDYFGPDGFKEFKGKQAKHAQLPTQVTDASCKKLWEMTCGLLEEKALDLSVEPAAPKRKK